MRIFALSSIFTQRSTESELLIANGFHSYIEWLSQLRHIHHAPNHPWPRWTQLQTAASHTLKAHTATLRHLFHLDPPPSPTAKKPPAPATR
jgi:hypothetical protein